MSNNERKPLGYESEPTPLVPVRRELLHDGEDTTPQWASDMASELAERLATIARLDIRPRDHRDELHENYAEARLIVEALAAHLAMNGAPE